MRKIIFSAAVILSVCVFASCSANANEALIPPVYDTHEANYKSFVVETAESSSTQIETTTISDAETSDIETSDDLTFLKGIGVYQLVEQDMIWNSFFVGDYSSKLDYTPNTIKKDNETYIELSLATRDDICDNIDIIQSALNSDLELSDDKSFYVCPFKSFQDLKNHMRETYTESYIDNRLSYIPMIEYDGSLYITDSGGVFTAREAKSASVIEKSDTDILFSVEYDLTFIEGETLNVNYKAVCENGKWLLDNIE